MSEEMGRVENIHSHRNLGIIPILVNYPNLVKKTLLTFNDKMTQNIHLLFH